MWSRRARDRSQQVQVSWREAEAGQTSDGVRDGRATCDGATGGDRNPQNSRNTDKM